MLDLDLLIVSSFHLLLVELGAMLSLLPPYIQFSPLDFPFNHDILKIHFSPLNCPVGSELKVNWYMASFAIDQLVRCLSYRRLEGCPIGLVCLGYHTIPSFSHGIRYLLQNVSDLLVRCFCLAIGIGVVWSSSSVVLLSIHWDTSCRSCLVKCEPSLPNMTLGNSKQGNVISWIIFFEFFESAATQEVLHPFGQIVHYLQDALALTYGKTHEVNSPYVD